MLCDIFCDCVHVSKLLLVCGDVEVNPGPSDDENCAVLAAIATLSAKAESRHEDVMRSFSELKATQEALANKVSDLSTRLETLETVVETLQSSAPPTDIPEIVATAVSAEHSELRSRLDDLEDRSRRDNLLFYGVDDNASETWAETENLVLDLIKNHLKLDISHEAIVRSHRLGSFVVGKIRPIIVKFSSFKTREKILSLKGLLKPANVSLGEDFCRSTRQSRKKLLEFAKASGQQFSLRSNKLVLNKKTYVYSSATDAICELHSSNSAAEPRNGAPNLNNPSPSA